MITTQVMNTVIINGTDLEVKEWQNQRVVTLKDIDRVHNRPDGTARKRFNDNKKRFIDGVDFFKITASEYRTAIANMDSRQQNDIILITQSGYLMLVKSFTDDLAWQVQRELVNSYFKLQDYRKNLTTDDILYALANQNKAIIERQDATEQRVSVIEEKINVIGAYDNSYMFEELKKAISSQVCTLTSDVVLKTIWSRYFYPAIHGMLKKHFHVSSSKNIPTKSLEEAKKLVYSWCPSDIFIQAKTIEMLEEFEKGTLSSKKMKVFDEWLNISDAGLRNVFAGR